MKTSARWILLCGVLALACAPVAEAQPDKPWKSWFPHIALQYTMPEGDGSEALDDGWGLAGGVTYKPEGWKIGIPIELGYTVMDVDRQFLQDNVQDPPDDLRGDATVWNLTGGVMWQTNTSGRFDVYLDANAGAYYTDVEIRSQVGWAWSPGFCTIYWCYPGGAVPVDAVQGESEWNLGANVGIGLAIALNNDSQIYIEAKYQYIDTDGGEFEWIPIQLGYRW